MTRKNLRLAALMSGAAIVASVLTLLSADTRHERRLVEQLIELAKGDTVNCTAFHTAGDNRKVTGTFVGFRVSR